MNEVSHPVPTASDKLKIQAQLTEVAGYLLQIFGDKEAAKLLRAAAKMVAPDKAEK